MKIRDCLFTFLFECCKYFVMFISFFETKLFKVTLKQSINLFSLFVYIVIYK